MAADLLSAIGKAGVLASCLFLQSRITRVVCCLKCATSSVACPCAIWRTFATGWRLYESSDVVGVRQRHAQSCRLRQAPGLGLGQGFFAGAGKLKG